MFFEKNKITARDRELKSILKIAQSIIDKSSASGECMSQPIYRYINAIGSSVLQKLLMQLFTGQKVDGIELLFFDLCQYYKFENGTYAIRYTKTGDNKNVEISLKDDLVIPIAWNTSRFVDNLTRIGSDCENPFIFKSLNHMSMLFLPVGVTLVHNGNHSILSGIIKREGVIFPTEVIDLSTLYESFMFDGTYYRDMKSKKIIRKVAFFELGVIYEIGRLLIKNNINFKPEYTQQFFTS